jgi:hypothetical protein
MDFLLAILPIFVVLIGMVVFYRSGTFVAFVGWGYVSFLLQPAVGGGIAVISEIMLYIFLNL